MSKTPPVDDHVALLSLWHTIMGTNGSGLISRMERLEQGIQARIERLEKVSGAPLAKRVARLEGKSKNIWAAIKDVVLLVVAVGSLIVAALALSLGGVA